MDRSALKSVHWTDLTGFAGRASPFKLDIVFANRTEDIQYLAIRDGTTGMHRIGWNDADGPRSKDLLDAVHENFEFTFEGVSDLFMRMGMFRQESSG